MVSTTPNQFTIGLTPPRGRLGYSLPTPRVLGRGPLFVAQSFEQNVYEDIVAEVPSSFKKTPLSKASSITTKGSSQREPLSPLDQIRPFPQTKLVSFPESWMIEEDEQEDYNDDMLLKLTNRLTLTPTEPNNLQRFTGDSLLSFNYSLPSTPQPPFDLGGSFVSAFSYPLNSSLNIPFLTSPSKDKDSQFLFPSVTRNPNKALITINAATSVILVANKVASQLFNYSQNDLIGLKIQQLFAEPYKSKQQALAEQNINASGQTVLVSGKVMDAITSDGLEFPVSVWMKKVSSDEEPRVIVVIEPVERCTAHFTVDDKGNLVLFDPWFVTLFGYDNTLEIDSQPLSLFIPSVSLEKMSQKQSLTGRTKDGNPFPLILRLEPEIMADTAVVMKGKVTVYASLSGMISFLPNGTIHGCNHHFSLMLLGYTQDELVGKEITHLIPEFYTLVQLPGVVVDIHSSDGNDTYEESIKDMSGSNYVSSSLFQSVSERSDYTLDFQLNSISEVIDEDDDAVFIEPRNVHSDSDGVKSECEDDVLCAVEELKIEFVPSNTVGTNGSSKGTVYYDYESSSSDDNLVVSEDTNDCDINKDWSCRTDTQTTLQTETQASLHQAETQTTLQTETQTTQIHNLETQTIPQTETQTTAEPDSTGDTHMFPLISEQLFGRDHPSCISTPAQYLSRPSSRLSSTASSVAPGGFYTGFAQHKDGSLLSIVFQLKQIIIEEGHTMYCLWLMRDCDFVRAKTADISRNTPDPQEQQQQMSPELATELNEEVLAKLGEYSNHYETLGPIGHGAFGFVKLASRREDGELVVVKFIRKATVIPEHWVEHDVMGLVPREICILAEISHVNIVQLLEAYENVNYFQLVMDKHGDGMDLFTFIESGPQLDESLISYMFRQVVSALEYLHSRSILHRDVKDENIILNDRFHMKLIDFGSAAYMKEGELFNTFCGTLEYCSPEVLMGNSYVGPELEMWSLGITLYTLVYGENPFFDVDEIISGHLQPPFLVSPGLLKTILWLLHPDPKSRATLADLKTNPWLNQSVDISQYSFESVVKGSIEASDVTSKLSGREVGSDDASDSNNNELNPLTSKQYLLTRTLT